MTIFVANTNVLEIQELKNAILDEFMNDADVTVTVREGDADGDAVTGQTWPVTMDYVAASNGKYRSILKDKAELTAGTKYVAVIDVDGGTDLIGHWEFPFTPKTRTKI